ncbi:hypothetical protein K0M31_015485 [Melipona bicolor]|uniref:Uncharacterized protein n=1 Tax=Melipona bicolor TaxID=60889 RepID=A0AA40KF31_9HYME|nr:hypothetical protein K0M31_015485 [Melipona bicolor]
MRFTAFAPVLQKDQPRVEPVDDGGDEEVNEEEAEGGRVRHKWPPPEIKRNKGFQHLAKTKKERRIPTSKKKEISGSKGEGSTNGEQNKAGRTRKAATRCDRIRSRGARKRLRGKGSAERRNGVRGKREIGGWLSVHAPVANVMIGPRKQKRQTLGPWPPETKTPITRTQSPENLMNDRASVRRQLSKKEKEEEEKEEEGEEEEEEEKERKRKIRAEGTLDDASGPSAQEEEKFRLAREGRQRNPFTAGNEVLATRRHE